MAGVGGEGRGGKERERERYKKKYFSMSSTEIFLPACLGLPG